MKCQKITMYAIGAIATNTAGLTPPPSQVQGHFQHCQLLSNNFLVSMAIIHGRNFANEWFWWMSSLPITLDKTLVYERLKGVRDPTQWQEDEWGLWLESGDVRFVGTISSVLNSTYSFASLKLHLQLRKTWKFCLLKPDVLMCDPASSGKGFFIENLTFVVGEKLCKLFTLVL